MEKEKLLLDIDVMKAFNLLDSSPGYCFVVISSKTRKREFSLHRGSIGYMLHWSGGIECFDKIKAMKMFERLRELVLKSNRKQLLFSME